MRPARAAAARSTRSAAGPTGSSDIDEKKSLYFNAEIFIFLLLKRNHTGYHDTTLPPMGHGTCATRRSKSSSFRAKNIREFESLSEREVREVSSSDNG